MDVLGLIVAFAMIAWVVMMIVGIIIALMPIILCIVGAVICFVIISAIANVIGFAFS